MLKIKAGAADFRGGGVYDLYAGIHNLVADAIARHYGDLERIR